MDTFTYLGSPVSSSTSLYAEISSRIVKAAAVMAKLNKRVWGNDLLSKRIKMCVYQACVLPTLLYGSESWTTYAREKQRLNGFHLLCLRCLLHIRWQDMYRVTKTEVLQRAGSVSIPSLLIQRCLRWLGHAHCMEPDRLPREILYGELGEGIRRMRSVLINTSAQESKQGFQRRKQTLESRLHAREQQFETKITMISAPLVYMSHALLNNRTYLSSVFRHQIFFIFTGFIFDLAHHVWNNHILIFVVFIGILSVKKYGNVLIFCNGSYFLIILQFKL